MTASYYTMDKADLERISSSAMAATVGHMVKDGLITEQVRDEFVKRHTMSILTKKSVLDSLASLLGMKDEGNTESIQFRVTEV